MKTKKWTTLVASSITACALSTLCHGQIAKPAELTGSISANSTSVTLGQQAELSWNFKYPATVAQYATISDPNSGSSTGVITATGQNLNISLKMLGQGVTAGSGSSITYYKTIGYVYYDKTAGDTTFTKKVFEGINPNINQSSVISLAPGIPSLGPGIPNNIIEKGKSIAFGGQYYLNGANGALGALRKSNTQGENPRSIRFLTNGQSLPSNMLNNGGATLESFLVNYLDATKKVKIGPLEVIVFMELTRTAQQTSDPNYDLQDLVMLVTFTPTKYESATYTTVIEETGPRPTSSVTITDSDTIDPVTNLIGYRKLFPPLTAGGTYTYTIKSKNTTTNTSWELGKTTVSIQNPPPKVQITIDSLDKYGRKADTVFDADTNTQEFTNKTYANPYFLMDPVIPASPTSYKTNDQSSALPLNIPAFTRRTRVDQPFKVYVTTTCGVLNPFKIPGTELVPALPPSDSSVLVTMSKQAYPSIFNYSQSLSPANSSFVSSANFNTTKLIEWAPPLGHKAYTPVPNVYIGSASPLNISTPTEVYFTATQAGNPSQPIASERIKVWPLSTGVITGVTNNQLVRFTLPPMTFTGTFIYPDARMYAVCYKGAPGTKNALTDTTLKVVPGSEYTQLQEAAWSKSVTNTPELGTIITTDGQWTIDFLEDSPAFGKRILDTKSFNFDRSINVNAAITTSN
jgi:hypothetical protein